MTNIDVSATERDISLMISRALNIPEPEHIDVVKLVSKWNLRKSRDYISFKVNLNRKWKSRAMDPITWPKHIEVREFVNTKRHNETWKPV